MIWMILDTFVVSSSCGTLENQLNGVLKEGELCFLAQCSYVLPHSTGGFGCIMYSCIDVGLCIRGDRAIRHSSSFLPLHWQQQMRWFKVAASVLLWGFCWPSGLFFVMLWSCSLYIAVGFLHQDCIQYYIMLLLSQWLWVLVHTDTAEQFWLAHMIVIGLMTWSLGCGDKEDNFVLLLKRVANEKSPSKFRKLNCLLNCLFKI